MKVVILAGGLGTRISEETDLKPKPMVEICGVPILEHLMKCYERFGFNDFIICCGYRGYVIKEYFLNYSKINSDITVNLREQAHTVLHADLPDWRVTLVDTGKNTMTGGRLLRIKSYVKGDKFLMTYGDGLSNVNIIQALEFHNTHGKIATMTSVKPPSRFGIVKADDDFRVSSFEEKPIGEGGRINGGFFILNNDVFDYIHCDGTVFESETLPALARDGQLYSYEHDGFWHCMDTLRDKYQLERMMLEEGPPWLRD